MAKELLLHGRYVYLGVFKNGKLAGMNFDGTDIVTTFVFPTKKSAHLALRNLERLKKIARKEVKITPATLSWFATI
jgi:hypothetical protein